MSSLTANRISADLDQFKLSMAQSQYNSGHYATVTHYRSVKPASWRETRGGKKSSGIKQFSTTQ